MTTLGTTGAAASDRASIQRVERREWWPDEYLDESMPKGRATPDAWLCRLDGGVHAYGIPGDRWYGPKPLVEGQVVAFSCCDTIGKSAVTLGGDGPPRWSPPVPAACSHLWDGDEIIAETPDEFVEWIRESIRSGWFDAEDEPFIAYLSRWDGEAVQCRFTAENGPPRFIPLTALPEQPAELVAAGEPQTDLVRPTPEA